MITELSSGPRHLFRTNRVNVKLHNLKYNVIQKYVKLLVERIIKDIEGSFNSHLGIQLGGVRSTSHVANSFMGTGFIFTPIFIPPLTGTPNKLDAPKTLLDELVAGIVPPAAATMPELMLRLPMPPSRLLEAVVELPPEAMVDPAFILCPLVKGVLGVPTTLAMILTA